MPTTSLNLPVALDPLQVASGLAERPGTLLLHTQRPWGRYRRSALLFDPRWVLRQRASETPQWSGEVPAGEPPAEDADRLMGKLADLWPLDPAPRAHFTGLAGCLSFELGSARYGLRAAQAPPFDLPDAWIGAFDLALVFGTDEPTRLIVSDLYPLVPRRGHTGSGDATALLHARVEHALTLMEEANARALRRNEAMRGRPRAIRGVREASFFDERWHARAVESVKHHLRAGDVYQVNLTGMATARSDISPFDAFLDQAARNPVPFAAFLNTGEATICSHSPELLLGLSGERAETAPIKGTALEAFGDWKGLRESAKECAEHLMIVDLCRNDLGAAARYGTVKVKEFMAPLRLHHLVHLVSRIEARVPTANRPRLLSDLFPGGSVTGAPKRRAIEIITRLETGARGPYTGSLGFFDRSGRGVWNIAIRTAVWQEGTVAFGCGGGIVLDSDPAAEYKEAVLKARSFFDTLNTLSAHDRDARPAAQQGAP